MQEIWKPVVGYEGLYEVSNLGRVKSLNYWKTGKEGILKPGKNYQYSRVLLTKNGKRNHKVSRLVAIAFIPNPNNLPLVCHIKEDLDDNGRLYNGADNLFWGTTKDNAIDRDKKGRGNKLFFLNNPSKQGGINKKAKSVIQYSLDGKFIKQWGCISDIERETGISQGNISRCCNGKQKKSGGFIWKFA